jgi:Transcription factor Pcc1.
MTSFIDPMLMDQGDGFIRLKIRGEDVVSLRAALNTWIRLVKIAFEMVSL